MLDFDTICDRCRFPLGQHKTTQLGWERAKADGSGREHVRFWQQGLCPDVHNEYQPSWDMYLFQYVVDGKLTFPYEDEGEKYRR